MLTGPGRAAWMLWTVLAVGCARGGAEQAEVRAPEAPEAPRVPAEAAPPPPADVAPRPPSASEAPPAPPSPSADEPGAAAAVGQAQWTAGIVDKRRPGTGMATLREVRVARHPDFDRFVLQFDGQLPGYRLEYVDRPVRQCGSGQVVEIAGDGWLSVNLEPAQAHDDQGRATVRERDLRPGLPIMRQLRLICDFEGQVEWVLGVASPNRYRVLELRDPARLVVDVRH